jgi:hypothetical protein
LATTADDAAKGKQLLRGRAKAKVETLTAELDAARLTLAQAEQVLGERMDDARDTTAAIGLGCADAHCSPDTGQRR